MVFQKGRVLAQDGHRPFESLGEELFGATGQVTQDGETIPFVVVDCRGQEVTIMITAGIVKLRSQAQSGPLDDGA